MRIAFLGLGAIGAPMARHLAARHELIVWNRTTERAQAFAAAHGATAAATPREAAAGAEAVVTCLPTSKEVAALLDGPDGLLAGLARGTILVDCTSGDPATSRAIAARLAEHGIAFVDAPVSGGTNGAEAAALTVMLGGSDADVARARPIVEAFGKLIVHMGPVGAGDAMKAVNNALLAVNIAAFAEGFAALVKAGVPAATATQVLNASSGRSFVTEKLVPERVLTGAFPLTFRLSLLDKDVGIALDLVRELGLSAPVLEAAGALTHEVRADLPEDADYLDTIRAVERRAGVEIRG
jgi:3-hydroxyisobutyrate dehydrogenase